MADADLAHPRSPAKTTHREAGGEVAGPVLQVERHDYTDLAPVSRPRAQGMRGFDSCYTDIVDYIVRCTHRIWDERDVGLIYTHYTHNCVVYGPLEAVYNREDVVRDTLRKLAELPDRRGMATQVIWRGQRCRRLLHFASSDSAAAGTPSSAASGSRPAEALSPAPSPIV